MSTPATATARSGRPRARIAAAATVIALMLPVGWAVLAGEAQPNRTLSLSSGSAWLASPERGYLSLIDGSSEQVVATLTGLGGPDLDVVADGESALVADSTNGTVARVDGASLKLSTPVRFGDPGAGLQVLAGDSASYVINTEARTASRIDPVRLTTDPPVNISAQPAAQQTLLADDGRLWTVDATGDGMTWIDPDGTTGRADSRPDTRLVQVAGKPVWVAGDNRLDIGWLAADGTHTDWPCSLGTRSGDHVQLLGSARGDQVFAAVSETGTLLVADAAGERCDATVPIGSGGADFGALAQSDRYVFVPDRSAGAAVVVDLDASAVVATLPLTDPGHDLELIARDGIVFYNDRDSEKAGVLEQGADGSWVAGTPLQKFDPQTGAPVNPPADTSTPATEPAPPVDLSPANELTTEPTTTPETTPPPDDQAAGSNSPQTSSLVTTTPSTPPPVVVTSPKTTPPPQTATSPVVNPPPGSTPGTTPAPAAPTITAFTADPATIGVTQPTTLSAIVGNPGGGRYSLAVVSADCSYRYDLPDTALNSAQQQSGALEITVPGDWACPGHYTATLAVTTPAGTVSAQVSIDVVTDPSTTPSITALACTPEHPLAGEKISCTATESVVGPVGTWTWSVVDNATGTAVVDPTDQDPNQPFTPTMASAGSFTVTLVVSYRGATDTESVVLLSSIALPDLIGQSAPGALQQLSDLGLDAAPTDQQCHCEPGIVISAPAAGTVVLFGDTVSYGVSDIPTSMSMRAIAGSATWTSAAGTLPFDGSDVDDRGFVKPWPSVLLEDGNTHTDSLETHPQWVDDGYIQGVFTLPRAIISGDQFKTALSFRQKPVANTLGNATFTVQVRRTDGTWVTVYSSQQNGQDGVIPSVNVDLSAFVGSTQVLIRIDAGGDSQQDWANWINPRIE